MILETILLPQKFPALASLGSKATLRCFVRTPLAGTDPLKKWPAILICPGGGYSHVSDREGEGVALEFLARGYQCFVLTYTCAPASYPLALREAAAALAFIRQEANEFFTDPSHTAVMGFSAGGHLAASLALFWDSPNVLVPLSLKAEQTRPDALCLGYPVITSGSFAHRPSFEQLLGTDAPAQLLVRLSLEHSVRTDMPPVFLWHTQDDATVPVENSLLFSMALRREKVPFELHIYPHGVHGLALATNQTQAEGKEQVLEDVAYWPQLCDNWLKNRQLFQFCNCE